MNPTLARLLAFVATLGSAAPLAAAPLSKDTPVHARPDRNAPVVATLPAGTEPASAADSASPADWKAVEVAGSHTLYVANNYVGKNFDVKPGAPLLSAARTDAAVVGQMQPGDKAEVSGLAGDWTQVKVEKKLVGYLPLAALEAAPARVPPPAPAPAAPSAGPRAAAESANLGQGASELPRHYEGTFVSVRSWFGRKAPYAFALNDSHGQRFAYLDTRKLLLTERIEKYLDRPVAVHGTARRNETLGAVVIEVESLRLK